MNLSATPLSKGKTGEIVLLSEDFYDAIQNISIKRIYFILISSGCTGATVAILAPFCKIIDTATGAATHLFRVGGGGKKRLNDMIMCKK